MCTLQPAVGTGVRYLQYNIERSQSTSPFPIVQGEVSILLTNTVSLYSTQIIPNGFCGVMMTYVETYFQDDGRLQGKCAGSSFPEEMLLKLAVKSLL